MLKCVNCGSTVSGKTNHVTGNWDLYHVEKSEFMYAWLWNKKSIVTGCEFPEVK